LRPHKTTENIRARKAFTLSFADAANVVPADYVGIVSGTKVPDKVARAGWHAVKSRKVDAPLFKELPLALSAPSSPPLSRPARRSNRFLVRAPQSELRCPPRLQRSSGSWRECQMSPVTNST
jgi:hypothetical protein